MLTKYKFMFTNLADLAISVAQPTLSISLLV